MGSSQELGRTSMRLMRTFLAVLFIAGVSAGQVADTTRARDGAELRQLFFPGPANSLSRPSLLPVLRSADLVISRDFPESSLGYLLVSQPVQQTGADLSWQLRLRPAADDPLHTVSIVLSGASAAGAAYLAYQHVKKYGFLK